MLKKKSTTANRVKKVKGIIKTVNYIFLSFIPLGKGYRDKPARKLKHGPNNI